MTYKYLKPVCPECGSDSIDIKSITKWNDELEQLEVDTNINMDHCYGCDSAGLEIEWVEVSK